MQNDYAEKWSDASHLLVFYGMECGHCIRMEPLVAQLERELGARVERHEVWHNPDNAKRMEKYDKGFCGGVPFFFNTKANIWLCGEVSYAILKDWAQGIRGNIEGL